MGDINFMAGIGKKLRNANMDVLDPERPPVEERRSIIVNHADIDVYELNPRLTANEVFEEIKSSIASRWLDQKLSVTQRPGSSRYLLKAGGGTRHQAISELLEETGDFERYGSYEVDFVPWTNEIDIIVAHGTENILRSGLNLFEQAMFEKNLREHIIKEDSSFQNASLRERQERYKQLGYTVSPAYLSNFDYIFTWLHPDFERALLNGMGPRTIINIRAIDTKFRRIVERRDDTAAQDFDEIYRDSIRAVGNEAGKATGAGDIDTADLQHELVERLAQRLNTTVDDLLRPGTPETGLNLGNLPDNTPKATTPTRARSNQTTPEPSSEAKSTPAPQSSSAQTHDDLAADLRLAKYREQGEQISLSLASDYGLLRGAYYAIPEVGLGYGIENPDHIPLVTGDTEKDLDSVIVLTQLHAIFWSLRETEISSGRLHQDHELLQRVSAHSDPTSITSSETLQAIPQHLLTWRLQHLRLQSAIDRSQGKMTAQRSLVERLDDVQFHAEQYAIALSAAA